VFGCPEAGATTTAPQQKLTKIFLLVHWENCNRWPPKAGIGEIVKFGSPFLVDIDREKCIIFKECGLKNVFLPTTNLFLKK
jgi:hypothetical protein